MLSNLGPIAGLKITGLDLSLTPYNDTTLLNTYNELKYLNLEESSILHAQFALRFTNLEYLNLANTPIKSFITRPLEAPIKYLNLANTTIRSVRARFKSIEILNVSGAKRMSLRSIFSASTPPQKVILSEDQLAKNPWFKAECTKQSIEFIVLNDQEKFQDTF